MPKGAKPPPDSVAEVAQSKVLHCKAVEARLPVQASLPCEEPVHEGDQEIHLRDADVGQNVDVDETLRGR